MHPIRLNLFQKGFLQHFVTLAIYICCIPATAWIVNRLEKHDFITIAESALKQGELNLEHFQSVKNIILNANLTYPVLIACTAYFCAVICWLFMRWVANFNWSFSVLLPRAIEFREAMHMINIYEPSEEIACVRKYNLSVFIADKSFNNKDRKENVRARLYAFSRHVLLKKEILERYIGKKILCLDAAEYEKVVEKIKKEESSKESVIIAGQAEEIRNLRGLIASLTQENARLTKERDELSNKVRIQPAQEKRRIDRLRVEGLLWAVFNPMIKKMTQEAPAGKRFTTPEILVAFADEWKRRGDLREKMQQLTGSEEAKISEDFLKAIKKEFQVIGKLSSGGRPKKNP